ncbi:MAG: ATP synthase F0 subunit B [Desulfobacterales bacterium]|nr:ATP synthase F0 subunit B [Desulfobacterales bacterium]
MVDVDLLSLSIQIINFILLIWILNVILYRPIRNILLQRKNKVSGFEDSIENLNKGADEKKEAFASGLKDARSKGVKEKESLMQAAADEEKEIINRINEKAAAELAKVKEKIVKDTEEVRVSLQKETDTFANEIGNKILGRAV